jgi:hypothetical protein
VAGGASVPCVHSQRVDALCSSVNHLKDESHANGSTEKVSRSGLQKSVRGDRQHHWTDGFLEDRNWKQRVKGEESKQVRAMVDNMHDDKKRGGSQGFAKERFSQKIGPGIESTKSFNTSQKEEQRFSKDYARKRRSTSQISLNQTAIILSYRGF